MTVTTAPTGTGPAARRAPSRAAGLARYAVVRVGQGLLTIFLTISTVFVLVRLAPGDPAAAYAGPNASPEDLERIRAQLGLDEPVLTQYLTFLRNLLSGDLGTSYSFQAPALDVVLGRVPYTITLAVSAVLVTTLVAVPLGIWMARRADTGRELGANVVTVAGQSMPDFWSGVMLLTLFSVLVPVLPASGFATWSGLVLPTLTVAILQIALISRLVRREMTGALTSPYLTVARARGASERTLVWRFAMANSAIPVLTALGTRFAAMLNGVVVVEVVFSWPGVGSLVVRALETRDYPLIQATVLVTAALAIGVQLLIDLAYPLLDPRVRLGKESAR
ncbi:Dipeptide transport system permease protein DppB [Pseudonocardia sp. Ae168_Ps1]|uniref:ABC transporter permease n=1 Tax=unclassified Pseudonocardia TaxID=2619320 RepID=UPI000960D345|nr:MULTISPECIES: ABC transporter permease [unclassified Pseudonocardia]OLL73203.1 Dipeptide transport system permease protein DppB [Pseudonocardia sp. Ae150A_Ps1]OLL79180.1 Dipeptide transport system permease protein DppB [Pseudonocardia sp. Ae168_Ps1]OLL86683.1 Dipeptide transport system permease protein DppB [Pseudonocardia sp. Ae263_Ps1]OLL93271.1 Dipeptide transport system permease protein DppB [Pseudonocardia sp. Ae356_Ps1]